LSRFEIKTIKATQAARAIFCQLLLEDNRSAQWDDCRRANDWL